MEFFKIKWSKADKPQRTQTNVLSTARKREKNMNYKKILNCCKSELLNLFKPQTFLAKPVFWSSLLYALTFTKCMPPKKERASYP